MNIKTKLILATTAVALLAAPASARTDLDEGLASAYPRFGAERTYDDNAAASAYASGNNVVRPRVTVQQRWHQHHSQLWHPHHSQPWW